ncbi:ABC transporter ATP-binding protein [Alkalicoccus halolimnae]|uniref:ABC transporter ATP-binding protein n=1 Tax=Alkalicoccus halolimnae TaxID=1667239 RepID=A0A5C7FHU8_9BACI|nr:ABC transporter ATP-binding protein [Alkalicoccus halolimnae]TXF83565.1 ABC transporter ATP-binding protein [Alkalicoccus halolimnae]
MIEAVNLSKSFKNHEAVKGVHFFIEQGEIVGLLGPNGAGKSTAISMISSLVKPTEGEVTINNISVTKNPGSIRRFLGVVPQEIAVFQDLTARENLKFFGRAYRLKGKTLKKRITEVLEIVGLTDRADDLVKNYSGGMKRRINIAVALLHHPQILIMDEPTVGIDPQSRSYILETVRRLNREENMTIIYTSHYMEEVEYLCDRVYIMDHGEIIASGRQAELQAILTQENTIVVQFSRVANGILDRLQAHPLVSSVTHQGAAVTLIAKKDTEVLGDIFVIAQEAGVQLQSVEVKSPTLEDVFLHLTGRTLRN